MNETQRIAGSRIVSTLASPQSPMPDGLLDKASDQDVADASGQRLEGAVHSGNSGQAGGGIDAGSAVARGTSQAGWSQWATEPDVGRVAHGVPARVDRLRCLGNAVVPQVAQYIGRMIAQHARGTSSHDP